MYLFQGKMQSQQEECFSINVPPQKADTVPASPHLFHRIVTFCHLIDRLLCSISVGRCRSRRGPAARGAIVRCLCYRRWI